MILNWLKSKILSLKLKQLYYLAIIIYVVGIACYLLVNYRIEKKAINNEINEKLLKAAQSLDYLLPMNYHDKAINNTAISEIEFNEILQLLSLHANNYGVRYIYTIVEQNGKLYFTASSATSYEIRTGQNLTYYWQEYNEADKAFYEAFKSNLIRYIEYTDRWGSFRTIIIPKISLTGKKYLACADIDISYIDKLLWKKFFNTVLLSIFFTLIISPFIYVLYRYNKRITVLYEEQLTRKDLKISYEEKSKIESIKQLKLLEERYTSLLDMSPFPVVILTASGKIIDSNKAFQKLIGLSKHEINHNIIFTLPFYIPINVYEKIIETLNTNKIIEEYDITLETSNKQIQCRLWGTVIEKNFKNEYLFIIQDKTQEVKLYKELEETQKMAEELSERRTAFIASIIHDLRTPLNAIIGFSELLKDDIKDEQLKNEYLDIITSNSKNLLFIINDLIDLSKIEAGQLKIVEGPCYLNQLFNRLEIWLIEELKHKNLQNKIQIIKNIELNDNESIIIADENRLNQVLTNLLNNALKFTEEGSIEFGYHIKGQILEFYVKDTGIGMTQEDINLLFEYFAQGTIGRHPKYKGSGLGLAISKRIIELMGGSIWVQSQLNKGTTFYFTLPFKPIVLDDNIEQNFS